MQQRVARRLWNSRGIHHRSDCLMSPFSHPVGVTSFISHPVFKVVSSAAWLVALVTMDQTADQRLIRS
eukprot:9568135-Karenia_brevis.AAC.1